MALFKNSFYDSITDKRTIPYDVAGTGTIQSVDVNVTGAGTLFLTELKPGDWIYVPAQNEVQQVYEIASDTYLVLKKPFGVNIPALTVPRYTPGATGGRAFKEISVCNVGAAAGQIDGKAFPVGLCVDYPKQGKNGTWEKFFVDPIIVEATGTTVTVQGIRV